MTKHPDTTTVPSTVAHPDQDIALLDRCPCGGASRLHGLDEEAAYGVLRKLAMDTGRPIAAVAADLVAFANVLKGKA